MTPEVKHTMKSRRLKYKLWVAYFLLSVIPLLFLVYLLNKEGIIGLKNLTYDKIAIIIGIGALVLMSISALLLLYRSVSSLEQVTQKTLRFVKEYSPENIIPENNDEAEKLNLCFTEMVKALQMKINEANKYVVDLGEANKKLTQLSIKDGLTNLYNHVYIKERLDNELKRAMQFNHPLSILMIDIDDFKKCNDLYGHLAGDNCLEEISELIHNNIRDIDIASRYGGEEFLIILPGTKSNEALQVADKVRQAIANYKFSRLGGTKQAKSPSGQSTASQTFSLTISIGVAYYSQNTEIKTVAELIRCADNAMYQAKKKGKNQSALYV